MNLREQALILINKYLADSENKGEKHLNIMLFIEAVVCEAAMKLTNGNQVRAASVLNISRTTLRTKLKYYFDTTHVGNRYHAEPVYKFNNMR